MKSRSYWDEIRFTIDSTVPFLSNGSPNRDSNILTALLTGKMQCWVIAGKGRLKAIMTTTVVEDACAELRTLMIYSLYGFLPMTDEEWQEEFSRLVAYAKSVGCNVIAGYTKVERLVELAKKLGGDASYTFIQFEVK